jgi:hypothetical protein
VLGVNVATVPPVPLPLPPLPRRAKLVSVDPTDGALALSLSVTDIDEPVTVERVRWATTALRRLRVRPGFQMTGCDACRIGRSPER